MLEAFAGLGALVAVGWLIKVFASAIQSSGLEEVSFKFRFKGNGKPPNELNQ